MRSDHLSKHVKRHPGYEPDMLQNIRRDKPQSLVSILINQSIKDAAEEEVISEEQRKRLKSVAPSQVRVARADSTTTSPSHSTKDVSPTPSEACIAKDNSPKTEREVQPSRRSTRKRTVSKPRSWKIVSKLRNSK